MLLVDSLEIADQRRFEPDIRKFILDIYKVEGKPDHKKAIGKFPLLVPQQRNKDDCGFFVLYLIDFKFPFSVLRMDENWFTAESVQNFCNTLIAYYGR
ncbi:hypothetical protein MKW98_002370 [Papaver atlanticum]|uniref:Ubiquitin-like protease family profile domain-containing protein n=1 Tax=Papaver atlanticum TaxID=357466 RepID=A0AAD4SA26_9MAGN|nr:hypothetical protein MKW98_002370 [Papaver atlanticum]